ncbi:---NA---, partial [Olea europaea subsp. europaea]
RKRKDGKVVKEAHERLKDIRRGLGRGTSFSFSDHNMVTGNPLPVTTALVANDLNFHRPQVGRRMSTTSDHSVGR